MTKTTAKRRIAAIILAVSATVAGASIVAGANPVQPSANAVFMD
jgi:hypothetical protein